MTEDARCPVFLIDDEQETGSRGYGRDAIVAVFALRLNHDAAMSDDRSRAAARRWMPGAQPVPFAVPRLAHGPTLTGRDRTGQ